MVAFASIAYYRYVATVAEAAVVVVVAAENAVVEQAVAGGS